MNPERYWTIKDLALALVVTSLFLGLWAFKSIGMFFLINIGLAILGINDMSWQSILGVALGLLILVANLSLVAGPAVGGVMLWRRRPKIAVMAALIGLAPSIFALWMSGAGVSPVCIMK